MTGTPKILKPDDYFRFNAPFRQWLFDYKNKQLGDFKTDDARIIFTTEFIVRWNESTLPNEYYVNGPNMKTNFSKRSLHTASTGPKDFTKDERSKLFNHEPPKQPAIPHHNRNDKPQPLDKSFLKRRAEDLDELLPRREGHAKVIEDRRKKSAYTQNEKSLDYEMADEDLFSGASTGGNRRGIGSTDDYKRLLQLERERDARRQHEILQKKQEKEADLKGKIEKYNQREQEVQNLLKSMIGKKQQ